MGLFTFRGGTHVPHSKDRTEKKPIVNCPPPASVFLSMRQHIGAPSTVIVKPGEEVHKGQVIGQAGGFVSAHIHSSVSGTVKKIHNLKIMGVDTTVVEIENNGQETWHESVKRIGDASTLTSEEIRKGLADSGIVGMGGAGFPLHVKLSPPPEKKIDTFIINGAECEPYLTTDHRLMLEQTEEILQGARLIMKALEVDSCYFAVEDNKGDAIEALKSAVGSDGSIQVVSVKTKYPQGAEKQLINAITKREVPSGGLPMDVGCVVSNVATTKAVGDYFERGIPLIERICTVTGSGVNEPINLKIKVGTKLSHLVEQAGGLSDDAVKVILGGPMMGNSVDSLDIPSTKTTGGLLILNEKDARIDEPTPCMRCGRCVDVCPVYLQPAYISFYTLQGNLARAESFHPLDCIECGSCSFICPARRPLVHSIRVAKRQILESRKKS
jgi:electron transport complex protein RnfC